MWLTSLSIMSSKFIHVIACVRIAFFKLALLFKKDFIYFIFREGKGGEREGEKHQCVVVLLSIPHWGPSPQPRHVPWPGIKPATLGFSGQRSIQWATPARAELPFFSWMNNILLYVYDIFAYPFSHQWTLRLLPPFWLLWMMLLWTRVYKYLFKSLLSILWEYLSKSGIVGP